MINKLEIIIPIFRALHLQEMYQNFNLVEYYPL